MDYAVCYQKGKGGEEMMSLFLSSVAMLGASVPLFQDSVFFGVLISPGCIRHRYVAQGEDGLVADEPVAYLYHLGDCYLADYWGRLQDV